MKNFLSLLIILIITNDLFAQKTDTIIARAHYIYTNHADTIYRKPARSQQMVLFMSKSSSFYTSIDRIKHHMAVERALLNRDVGGGGKPTVFKLDPNATTWMNRYSYFYIDNGNKFYTKAIISQFNYLYEDEKSVINWKLTKDMSTINGIKCEKANALVDGVLWTAWFASSIPFPFGPEKLNGLPGLILMAYTENKQISIEFSGLENAKYGDFYRENDAKKDNTNTLGNISPIDYLMGFDAANAYFDNVIKLPSNVIKTTKEKFKKLEEAYNQDPKGFVKAQYRQ